MNPLKDTPVIKEVKDHYQQWNEDNDRLRSRENGWNDVTDAYWGKLPADWPYFSRVTDPRIRTSVLEKKARLTNSKLRGRLTPREGGDVLKARINNAILDFQWDNANDGGTMNAKWGTMDTDTRLFASGFGITKWKYETDKDGKVVFNGNEFSTVEKDNVGLDPTCIHVRNAKWVQIREWTTIEDLERNNDVMGKKKQFPGLEKLKQRLYDEMSQDRRDSVYTPRNLQLKGLEDHVGDDKSFPVIEVVTEYRVDRWITFAPKHDVILRDIENPYLHRRIPVVQLRYYPLSDDPRGESEVEPVLSIWRAIQATLCGFLDSMNIHMRPPLKVIEGQARMETIIYGPEAVWLMNSLDAVQEFRGSGEALNYFQTTYSSLVSAYNNAMGDLSQGNSSIDPFNNDKTATEVKATVKQQTVRDQNNQIYLAEAIQDMMQMWLSNNQQFLFMNPENQEMILKIIGPEAYAYFKKAGLDEMVLPSESAQMIHDIVEARNGEVSDTELQNMVEAGKVPKFPVVTNPKEKNPEKIDYRPKMQMNETEDMAELTITPDDLDGSYSYIPDVKSMSIGAGEEQTRARTQLMTMLINPTVLQLLQQEGFRPKIKEILSDNFEDAGSIDSSRYFESIGPAAPAGGGAEPNPAEQGLPGGAPADAQLGDQQQMGGPTQLPQPGGVQQGLSSV